jgi:hypothetical protein
MSSLSNAQAAPSPVAVAPDLGPLGPLIGIWEGDQGHDDSYVYTRGEEHAHFRERATFTPAGPARNGAQSVYRLDYRLAACRLEEVEPFHVEIGYWYWDPEHELVMRGLLTPRGIAVLAGGTAKPDDTIIMVVAALDSDTFGILSNPYLLETARTTSFEMSLDLSEPNRFSYRQKIYMHHARLGGTHCHQNRNTLKLISRTPALDHAHDPAPNPTSASGDSTTCGGTRSSHSWSLTTQITG